MAIEFKVKETNKLSGGAFIRVERWGEHSRRVSGEFLLTLRQHWLGGKSYECLESPACPHCQKKDETGKSDYPKV